MYSIDSIKRIYIDSSLQGGMLLEQMLPRLPEGIAVEYTDEPRAILDRFLHQGRRIEKEELLLYRFPGRFISSCPGSDGMVCCAYHVINFGIGCLYDCHYCYLQSFMNNPLMTLFGNIEDLFAEIDERTRGKNFHFRIGTGEYTDSLALEPLTGLSSLLVRYFADHPNASLELKTKSANVEGLLELEHRGNTVVSWSLNPQDWIDQIEPGTASLEQRLAAAEKVQSAGYRLAFHLDPLVYFPDWERQYHRLLEQLFDRIRPDRIAWISTGSFRYTRELKEVIQARFPEDRLTREGEMVQAADGKSRYFKTIRQEMFSSIKRKIEAADPRLFLYLCMETRRMWQDVFGSVPGSGKNLDALFEGRRQYMETQAGRAPAGAMDHSSDAAAGSVAAGSASGA